MRRTRITGIPQVQVAVDALEADCAAGWHVPPSTGRHAGAAATIPTTHEWRHGDPPSQWQSWFPRPTEECQIVRHKSFAPPRCTVDEAAAQMDDLDYDFHLFTELGSGQDSVLYRAGPTGYRLAQPDLVTSGQLPLTVSEQPALLLTTQEAIERLNLTGLPFVFYFDGDHARGRPLHHRYDGHYGLITPES